MAGITVIMFNDKLSLLPPAAAESEKMIVPDVTALPRASQFVDVSLRRHDIGCDAL
ncbi:MAG TPA: hypothetical protein VFA60_10130 [Terriglobales bacterium]|nr:hypothetical protein [Terriglobales bacterium]